MELVEGPTLADRLKSSTTAFDEALAIAKQIAEALEYAHERGVVLRDLKPANIKLTGEGSVKILDFSLAKALDPGTQSGIGSACGLFASGSGLTTHSPASDIYHLFEVVFSTGVLKTLWKRPVKVTEMLRI